MAKKDKKDKEEKKDGEKKEGGTITQQDDEVSITDDVRGADYYHGLVPRVDIEPLLKKDGDFLLRKTDNKGQIVLAISAFHNDRVCHFMVNQDVDNSFYIEEHHEKSVSDLIQWHMRTKTALSTETGCKLRTPIERPNWLLNHDSLRLKKKLGEGAFGEVYLAEFSGATGKSEVAVKTMRDEASREARLKFMKEARLMRKFAHKHVVRIFGVAVHENPLMIVMEFCTGGSLVSYLRKNKEKMSLGTKLRFVTEAADGLWYLERMKCIHRDIAARNCLLTGKNELKISDFGMSDDKMSLQDDKIEKVPVKWLAPETMQQRLYSTSSDVWSYGIMVWEVYSEGADPYPGWTNLQTRAKVVMHDYRMEMPKDTPKAVSTLIAQCWEKEPGKRPNFGTIYKKLKEINKKEDSTMDTCFLSLFASFGQIGSYLGAFKWIFRAIYKLNIDYFIKEGAQPTPTMTDNRLVKLGNLLESKNRTIRNEAASVLGQIPFTNVYLLPTLRKYLHNTAWDTRVSAALALGYVLKGMPAANGIKVETIPKQCGIEDMDLVAVIRDYRSLLCSEGDELSASSVKITTQQQRQNIDKHLNLSAKIYGSKAFLQDHDIDPSLILASDKSTSYDKLELAPQLESIEIDPSDQIDAAFGELIKFVVYDMASPKWQMRHGAFLALNEVLTHAFERLPPQWIETLVQRVLEVLALDRFVDFVTGSNSVAPVREAAAQCLCVSLCKLAPDSKLITHVIRLLKTLLDLSEDSFWQCRQTALLVFKYLFAAMDPVILGDSIIFVVLARMDDTNDEVVSATIVALASLFSNARLSSEKRRQLVNTIMSSVWNKLKQPECLKQLRDGVDSVLTDLVGIVDVYAQVEPNANLSDSEFRIFVDLLDPRLITRTLKILQCLRVSLMKPIELSDATLHQLLKMLYRCCLFVPAADGTPLLDAALNILLQLVDVFGHRFGTLDLLHNTVGYWIGCLTMDEKKAELDVFAYTVDGPTSNSLEPFEYMCGTEICAIVEAERPNIIIERKIILARFLSPIVDALYHSGKVIREQPVHLSIQFIFHPYLRSALLSQRLGAALMLNCWARMYRRRALRLDIPPLIFPEVAVREAIEALGTPTGGIIEVNNSIQNLHHESNEFLSYCRRHGAKEEDMPDASLANQMEPYVTTAYEASMKHCKDQNKPLVKQRYDYVIDLIKTTKATMRTHANRVNALLASALCFFNHALPKLSPMIRPLMESIEYEDLPIMAEETLFDAIPIMLTLSADRDPCPHVKMIKNLTLGLVSSEANTPFPASWVKDGTEVIAVLGDMSFAPDEKYRRSKNCEMVFNACMKTFGPSLFAVCKEFEKYLTLEIDPVNEFDKALERIEVVRVLFHQWKVFPTAEQVDVLLKLIAHANPAVRFRVNRLIVEFAKVDVYETMNLFYPGLLIHIGNIDSDAARAGAVECLLLLSKLEDHLVGTTSLLAPIAFSAISDKIECVRDAASGAFRRMVQILPLEKDKAAYVDRYVPSVAAKYKGNLDFLNVLASPGLLPHLGKSDIPALRDDVDLRPYQFEGITWMMFLHKFGLNGILADDMGLGKTLQTLCLLSIVHNSPKEDDEKEIWSLIVCPKTLVNHWCFEWEKYFPNTKHMRRLEELNGSPKHYGPIVVASYDDVRNNAILKSKRWNYIILDEGHCIRNHTTQLFEVISNLIAKHRLILSGTPVQNSPADLWALFRFLMPGYLSTRSAFHQKYIKPMLACRHPKATDQQTKDGEAALQQLHRQVLPFLMRRLKADVLNELPDKVVQDCMCQLTDVQRKLYAAVVDRCTLKRENEGATDECESLSALHTLITLRKLVDHPLLIRDVLEKLQLKEFDVTKAQNHALDLSGKLVALKEILTECQISKDKPAHGEHSDASSDGVEVPSLNQHRALIFCQWRASVDLVAEYLDSGALGSGISYVRLDGTVKPGDRQSVVERFNQDESIDLMLLTTHIGGVGLNLTGADVVIFLDHDWNPVKDLQAIDRAHRLGQRKTVNVYRLITQGSIEEKIMRYQKLKSDTANVLVGADNRSLGSMATDELLELFTLDSGGSSSGNGSGDSEPQAKRRKYTAAAARLPAGVPGSSANPADKWSIEDLWDDSQYEEQHSISSFLRKSNL